MVYQEKAALKSTYCLVSEHVIYEGSARITIASNGNALGDTICGICDDIIKFLYCY